MLRPVISDKLKDGQAHCKIVWTYYVKDTLQSLASCFCFSVFLLVMYSQTEILLLVFVANQTFNLEEQFKKSSLALRGLTIQEVDIIGVTCRIHLVHPYYQPRLLSFPSRLFPCSNFGRLRESPIFGNLVPLNFGSNCAFQFKGCSWCFLNMKMEIKKEILLFKARFDI